MDTVIITDTLTVMDTVIVEDIVTVTDTLRINVELTGTSPEEIVQIKVFPNPTRDILNIDIPDYSQIENYTLQIMDVNSRVVHVSKLNQKLTQINMSEFGSTGLYFLLIYNEDMELLHNKKILLE